MGIIVYPLIASRNERHVFPNIPPNWSMSHLKPSQTQEIEFEQLEESKTIVYYALLTEWFSGRIPVK